MESKKLNTLIRSLSSTETKKLLDLLYRRKYDKDGKEIKPDFKSGKRLLKKGSK